jgi:ribose transport system permease protein
VSGIPPQLQTYFGLFKFFGVIPAPAVVTAVFTVIMWFILARTSFGLRSLALGSSRQAAIRAGIDPDRHLLALFVLAGFAAGICSVMDCGRFATTNVGGHSSAALAAISGVVIGGGSIFGGEVSIVGAVLGALLAVILSTGLIIIGLMTFYQDVAIGIVLLLAVYLRGRSLGNRE